MIKPYLPPQFAKLVDISDWRFKCRCSRVPAKGKSDKILVKRSDQPEKKTPSKST